MRAARQVRHRLSGWVKYHCTGSLANFTFRHCRSWCDLAMPLNQLARTGGPRVACRAALNGAARHILARTFKTNTPLRGPWRASLGPLRAFRRPPERGLLTFSPSGRNWGEAPQLAANKISSKAPDKVSSRRWCENQLLVRVTEWWTCREISLNRDSPDTMSLNNANWIKYRCFVSFCAGSSTLPELATSTQHQGLLRRVRLTNQCWVPKALFLLSFSVPRTNLWSSFSRCGRASSVIAAEGVASGSSGIVVSVSSTSAGPDICLERMATTHGQQCFLVLGLFRQADQALSGRVRHHQAFLTNKNKPFQPESCQNLQYLTLIFSTRQCRLSLTDRWPDHH